MYTHYAASISVLWNEEVGLESTCGWSVSDHASEKGLVLSVLKVNENELMSRQQPGCPADGSVRPTPFASKRLSSILPLLIQAMINGSTDSPLQCK